jgi:phenylacetate-CoA ligase
MSLYQKLVRDVFVPLSLWRAGELAQLRYLRQFERTQFLPADELRDLQWHRLQSLLSHAYSQCPFYRERLDHVGLKPADLRGPEDLRALPVLEKRDIQEQGERMVARAWPRHDLIRNQTGGSTGSPISFYLSGDRKCSRAAATLRHNRWAGWEVGDSAAVLWGAPLDRPADTWRSRLRGRLLREPLWLDTSCLTEAALDAFYVQMHRNRPRIVLAYARSAVLFARYLRTRRLEPYHPHALVTSAEVLEDDDRTLLEQVFGCPVFNRYGCREVSVIASECPAHTGLHVMAEGLFVEIETPQGPAAPGQVGSILVTDLLNGAMPLIRYRIGDLGAWAAGDCPCGRHLPRLARVAGRVTDFVVGSDGRLVSGVFLATYVVAHRPSLGQVQIRQDRNGAVLYRVKPGRDFHPTEDVEYLRGATRRHLGDGAVVRVEVVDELPTEPSGKFLFSRSEATPDWFARPAELPAAGRAPLSREAELPAAGRAPLSREAELPAAGQPTALPVRGAGAIVNR